MRTLKLEMELLDDVIQSSRAASAGHHESLPYIQGASLLGAVASRLYEQMGQKSYAMFHSSRVCFGDVRPLSPTGSECLPVPMAWVHDKGTQVEDSAGGLDASLISISTSFAHPKEAEGKVQMREGYFSRFGEWIRPGKSYRLRTAIDGTAFGRPKDEALFGYESLCAGSRWLAKVRVDDDLADELQAPILAALEGAVLRLGASRGAEYGRVKIRSIKTGEPNPPLLPASDANKVLVYLVSDTALIEPTTGVPSLAPKPGFFGLPDSWHVVPHRSAVLIRRYSPFNNYRRRRDLERQVLRQGSVLVFEGQDKIDLKGLARVSMRGMGAYRQDGLGQVMFDPWFLHGEHPAFKAFEPATSSDQSARTSSLKTPALGLWMQAEVERQASLSEVWRAATGTEKQVSKQLKRTQGICPGRSQWQRVASFAEKALLSGQHDTSKLTAELDREVFGYGAASHAWANAEKARQGFLSCGKTAGLGGKTRIRALALAASLIAAKVASKRKENDTEEG